MDLFKNQTNSVDLRKEARNVRQLWVKVKMLYDSKECEGMAYTTDTSDSGIGLLTPFHLPIGSNVEIYLEDNSVWEGEIVNSDEEWELWGWVGANRLCVRLTNKRITLPI
jgi:hypothetical protein